MNTVSLIGRLGASPDQRALPSTQAVATFRLAVAFGSGEKRTTDWFDVVAYGRLAETTRHLAKGQRVGIAGRLRTHTWDDPKAQEKRHRVEIVANSIDFLDAPGHVDAGAAAELDEEAP